jgi:long-chain acyl-CoA synthetase
MPEPANADGDLADVGTLRQLFEWRVARTPRREAYRFFDAASGAWVGITWQDLHRRVARFAAALSSLQLPRGARIAILLPNGVEAVCSDLAALSLGFVPVPMHALDNPASIAYILDDSGASLLLAASALQWRAIRASGIGPAGLRAVVVLTKDAEEAAGAGLVPLFELEQWLAAGPAAIAAATPEPGPTDLAALVYTSGTTGRPKGVMLTHANVVANVKAVLQRVEAAADDVFLSFLPLSHTFERTAGYYVPIAAGCRVAFARSSKLVMQDLQTIRPTILISVPHIYERVLAATERNMESAPLRRRLFACACNVGWRRFARAQRLPLAQTSATSAGSALLDALVWPLLDRLVARKLRAVFGGRLRLAVSGGAPLPAHVAHCFLGLGVAILQGYGMTETSPVIAANAPLDNDPSTVGRPLAGVEVKLGANRELLVRGPNVTKGYWRREDDTARVLLDGWLHTGDQADIEHGRIRIVGRVKEIIVTSTGEKIAPADLERAVTADPAYEAAYVFGDNRPFIGCVVVLSAGFWKRLAAALALDQALPESLEAGAARAAVLARIRDLTRDFPSYAQPRAVALALEPWTVENSLLTPTLKPKRANLAAHYAAQIDRMYQRAPESRRS